MTTHPTVNSTTGQTMTNERKREIRRYQIARRISALQSVLLTGELDAKHTKIVQEKIALLASQMYPTVKK
jgi:hypothetical protein